MSGPRQHLVLSNPLIVAIVAAVLLAGVDLLVFRSGHLTLAERPLYDLWKHVWLYLLLIGFGVYAQWTVARHCAYEARTGHLNAVLAAVRNVNQLITREYDVERLLQGACDCLVETRGYHTAWIAWLDDHGRVARLYEAGFGERFNALREWLEGGDVSECMTRALAEPSVSTINDPTEACSPCPLADKEPEDAILTTRLQHEDKLYGFLVACTDRALLDDPEEQKLFNEVSGDLAFALGHIEVLNENERAQHAQALASGIARALLETPSEWFDDALNAALETAGRSLGMDRAYVFLFSRDESHMSNTHEWCAPGIEPQMEAIQDAPVDAMPWWRERIQRGDYLAIPNVDALPPDAEAEKQEFQRQGIQSLLVVPLRDEERMVGFFGFDAVQQRTQWTQEQIRQATVLAGVILGAFQRHRAEKAMRESEAQYRRIVETANEGIAVVDADFVITFVNEKLSDMLGHSPEEGVGKSCLEFMDEESADFIMRESGARMRGQGRDSYELKLRRKDGSDVWVLCSASPILDGDGRFAGTLVMMADITDHKHAEEARRAREQELSAILDSMVEAVVYLDPDTRIVWANRAAEEAAGVGPGELTGMQCCAMWGGEEADECALCPADRAWTTGEPQWGEMPLPGGRVWTMSAYPVLDEDGAVVGVVKTMLDVTDRRQAEEALRESEERYRGMVEGAPDGVYIQTNYEFAYVNPQAVTLFGADSPEGLLGTPVMDRVHPDFRDLIRERIRLLNQEKQPVPVVEKTYLRLDGTEVDVEVSAVPVRYEGEDGALVFVRDITDRKAAQEQIARARDFYIAVLDEFPNPIWRAGTDAKCNYFNKAWLEFTGKNLEQELGDGWVEGVHPEDMDRCLKVYQESFEARRPFFMEYRLRHYTGGYHWLADYGQPMFDVDGEFAGYIGSCYDIQELKQAEEAQRLVALGQLAASVGHEFNNLLAAMSGRAQLAQALGTTESQQQLIETVLQTTVRAAKITRNLMGFARPSEPQRASIEIEEPIEMALTLAEREFTNLGIEVKREYHTDGHTAYADGNQMEQVFLNLILNSCHAMGDGGTLTLATRYVPHGDGQGRIVAEVRDMGTGIGPDALPRLFDPFFTTKRSSSEGGTAGSGLGLPVSQSILLAHGGTIDVESEPGVGTVFRITVPAWSGQASAHEVQPAGPGVLQATGSPVRILVADDEEEFLNIVGGALEQVGHDVARCATTGDCLQALSAGEFDVVVSDLMMPGGGGTRVLEAVRELERPPMVILVTGVLEPSTALELMQQGAFRCLSKPLELTRLLDTIGEAIAGRRAGGSAGV